MRNRKTDEMRKLHEKKRAEILDFCIAIANAHVTHINCQECGTPNEFQSYYFSGFVKVECLKCGEELDLVKLLNVKPNVRFMKWVSKRVPEDDSDRIVRNDNRTPVEVSSLIDGIENYTQPDGTVDFSKYNKPVKDTSQTIEDRVRCKKKMMRQKPKLDSSLTKKQTSIEGTDWSVEFTFDPDEGEGTSE